jgi:hypothetical protein
VATPDKEKMLSALGQAVSNAGKVKAIHTRLKAIGAERKPEAVMKISFGNDVKYKVGLDKLLVVTVSTL